MYWGGHWNVVDIAQVLFLLYIDRKNRVPRPLARVVFFVPGPVNMSSILSIPDVVDSTIKNALKKSAAAAGGSSNGVGGGKMRVFAFAKSHLFTLIAIISVALVVAVGVYMVMQHYKLKKTLNTDEEAGNESEDEYDDDSEQQPLVRKKDRADESDDGADDQGPVDDPNWTPLEALTPPDDG